MPTIQCLPRHVSELIAAGEVVERPASVVKEMVENSIDAGASAVVVEIEHGGLSYIRIADNGCGIAPEQLATAFLRHATSKVRTEDDLTKIGTLGFRGEALAAIAAVSHIDIFSRERGSQTGSMLHLDGGVAGEVTETGCPEGTTICVWNLFYNTPARMKFMKKDSAEGAAVAGIVQHLALSHPEVSFKLIRDGAEVLHTPGDGELHSAIYASIGRNFAMGLLPVHGTGGNVQVDGFVTKPLLGHGTRGHQMFFLNGRYIKSQLLSAAVEEAYRNQMMKGKFPGCVLHITMPVQDVDINVHPTKTTVKFASDKEAFDSVYYTVMDALEAQKKPIEEIKKPEKTEKQEFFQTMTAEEFREKNSMQAKIENQPLGSYSVVPEKTTAPEKREIIPEKRAEVAVKVPERKVISEPVKTAPVPVKESQPVKEVILKAADEEVKKTEMPARTIKEENTIPPKDEPVQQMQFFQPEETVEQQTLEEPKQIPWRFVGEVLKTYIICEDENNNVWLIDKHAAHERIRFDQLKKRTEPLMAQILLMPVSVTLEAEEYAAVLDNLELLREFAFECEDFGGSTILVREVPSDIRTEDTQATLEELAQKLLLGRADPASARDEVLHTMACKSAIKAGMITDRKEMDVLIEKVQSGEIQYCPHGRPVKYKLSKYEIEKLFKRA